MKDPKNPFLPPFMLVKDPQRQEYYIDDLRVLRPENIEAHVRALQQEDDLEFQVAKALEMIRTGLGLLYSVMEDSE